MTVEIRPVTDDDLDAYIDHVGRGFGSEVTDDEREKAREIVGIRRRHAAFDGDKIIGTVGTHGFSMAVPGEVDVSASGLTSVTVSPTHRRQGVLRAMMKTHFDDARANGETVSILWASEMAIYGRFGYGLAAEMQSINFDARAARLQQPENPDRLELVSATEARALIPALREQDRVRRPGKFFRPDKWWELRSFHDPESWRDGATSYRYVIAYRDDTPVGYATYRQKRHWNDNDIAEGKVIVSETGAVDLHAQRTLWSYLASVDLFPMVNYWNQPMDSLLPTMATEPRALTRTVTDSIHLRVLDIETALTTRRYDRSGEITFAVTDDQLPGGTGTYELKINDDGSAHCVPTDTEPELTVTAYGLGSLYLGWPCITRLGFAGHLEGRSGPIVDAAQDESARRLGRLLAWPVAPWCDEGF